MKSIRESDMEFGEYCEEDLFHIEHSDILSALGEGIKTVEFILKKNGNQLMFVEAKKSCPNPQNKEESREKTKKFEKYFSDITDKFYDSFQVYLASLLGRYNDTEEVGSSIRRVEDFKKFEMRFVLVVKTAHLDWLAAPKAILEERLFALRKIWNIKVLVLNEEMAVKYGMIANI